MSGKGLVAFFLVGCQLVAFGQRKQESLNMDWPAEYQWKVVHRSADSLKQVVMIIPGYEQLQKATIMGSMATYNIGHPPLDSILPHYRDAIDTGTVLTLMERNDSTENPWLLFKVETPITAKYTEAESDLYYVVEGQYAVYEIYVSIKKPVLNAEFVAKWSALLKAATLKVE